MNKKRMQILAGLLSESKNGRKEIDEEYDTYSDDVVEYLVVKVSKDPEYKKLTQTLKNLTSYQEKKIQITMDATFDIIWDDPRGSYSNVYLERGSLVDKVESSLFKSPQYKAVVKEFDNQIKKFMKDSEDLIKKVAKKMQGAPGVPEYTKIDRGIIDEVRNQLFLDIF